MTLGVGDLAERRDPTWTATVLVEKLDESIPADETAEEEDPQVQLATFLRRALRRSDKSVAC